MTTLTGKQRARLMGLSAKLPTMVQIGKYGVTEAVIAQIEDTLERRELVKIGVLKACPQTSKELLDSLAAAMQAEPIHAIGSKIILYRRSSTEGVEHIPLDDAQAAKQEKERAARAKAKAQTTGGAKGKTSAKPAYQLPVKKHGVHKGKGSVKK